MRLGIKILKKKIEGIKETNIRVLNWKEKTSTKKNQKNKGKIERKKITWTLI
jgi:hypothetical protein